MPFRPARRVEAGPPQAKDPIAKHATIVPSTVGGEIALVLGIWKVRQKSL